MKLCASKLFLKVLFSETKAKTLQNYMTPAKLEVNWISLFFLFWQIQLPSPKSQGLSQL